LLKEPKRGKKKGRITEGGRKPLRKKKMPQ